MKKTLAILAAVVLLPQVNFGQNAQIVFETANLTGGTSLPLTGPFVTQANGTKLDSSYLGQLWFSSTVGGTLAPIGSPVQFAHAYGANSTAGAEGAILASGSVTAVAGAGAAVNGEVALYAWHGAHATYAAAVAAGAEHGNSVDQGSGRLAVNIPVPGTPPNFKSLNGWNGFALVPEPATVTLGLFGLGGLIAARRRRKA